MPQEMKKPDPADIWPPRSRTPRRRMRHASIERSPAKVREAHWKALAMVATLEDEIEWLSCPLIMSWSETQAPSRSRDHHRCRSRGQKRRCHQVWQEDCHTHYFKYHSSQRSLEWIQRRCGGHWRSQFRGTARIGARGHLLSPGISQEFGGGEHEGTLPQTPYRGVAEVGDLEGSSAWNTQLVAGANHGTWDGWLQKAGMWGMDLFSTSKEGEWIMPGGEWPSGPTCMTVSLPEELSATDGFYLHLSGHLGNPAWEDGGIGPGPSVLGRES